MTFEAIFFLTPVQTMHCWLQTTHLSLLSYQCLNTEEFLCMGDASFASVLGITRALVH